MTTDPYYLSRGKHTSPTGGRCAMEWAAYLAGEPHSDNPMCVSHILTRFCIAFNDGLDSRPRQRLRPYLARTLGTTNDGLDEWRAWLCTDWLVRTYAPAWLDVAGLTDHAVALRELAAVTSVANADKAQPYLAAAWVAARNAARDATWAVAWDATWAVAWGAAGAAAGAAARNAARNVAWDATRAAASATSEILDSTVRALQESTFELLDRMLPTVPLQTPTTTDADLVCAR